MKIAVAAPLLLLSLLLAAGAGASRAQDRANPAQPDPDYCSQRDADPKKCTIQDGPPNPQHVIRKPPPPPPPTKASRKSEVESRK